MMRSLFATCMFVAMGLVTLGCGGGTAGQPPPDDPMDEPMDESMDGPMDEPMDEPMAEPEPPPSGPVEVTVSVRLGTQDGSATIQMIDQNGETVHEGRSGQSFTVPAGTYSVVANITDARVMIDTPSITMEDVSLLPGEPRTVEVRIPIARVRLNINRGSRQLRSGSVILYREGSEDEVASFRLSGRHVPISPGRYEADVTTGRTRTRVRGLVFMDGATQDVPVSIQ